MISSSEDQPRRPVGLGISGSPIPETDCPSCQKPWSHTELKRAALHPALKGSPCARRTKDLRFQICKLCDRVYSEHFDTRDRYTYFRFVGENALPLLAADSTFPSIVHWAAEDSSEESWMIEVLGSAVLKQRPEDLAWALEHVKNHQVEGLAAYGCSTHTVQRLAYDHLFNRGALEPESALVVIDDLGPLWQALDQIIMDESVEIPSRGYLLKTCWESLEDLRKVGARPGNEHVLYLPPRDWRRLFDRLDRVNRLASAVQRLLLVCESEPLALNTVLNDEQSNIRRLVNDGARVAPPAQARLAARLEALAVAGEPPINRVAYNSLYPVVKQSEKAGACDYEPAVIADALGLGDLH